MDPMTQPQTPSNAPMQTPQTPVKKKSWLAPVTAILFVIALLVAGWMWWSSAANKTAEEKPPVVVTITDNGFNPATIKIKKGQEVTWNNQSHGSQKMAGTKNEPQGFGTSDPLNFGDTYSFTYENAGTFTYYDPAKVEHQGTVIVE